MNLSRKLTKQTPRLMTRFLGFRLLQATGCLLLTGMCHAQPMAPRIYIAAQAGFESYVSAAIIKKHVPAVVTQNQDEAQFSLTSTVLSKEENTGSKIARCLFMYCAGIQGTQTATVQLINTRTGEVNWAYNVRKPGAHNFQSTAESVAKHLKQFLEGHPQ